MRPEYELRQQKFLLPQRVSQRSAFHQRKTDLQLSAASIKQRLVEIFGKTIAEIKRFHLVGAERSDRSSDRFINVER